MPKNRVFFPQQALDAWLEQGRIQLVDDEMTLKPDGARYRLTTAVRVLEEVAEGHDPHDLVGKVKSIEQLQTLGGEHCADSVVLGDNAYSVQEGFLGEPVDDSSQAVSGTSLASAARRAAGDKRASSDDVSSLMRFLLQKP